MQKICDMCRHFKLAGDPDEAGNCLIDPPQVVPYVEELPDEDDPDNVTWIRTRTQSEFPEVFPGQRACGQWEPNGIVNADGELMVHQQTIELDEED